MIRLYDFQVRTLQSWPKETPAYGAVFGKKTSDGFTVTRLVPADCTDWPALTEADASAGHDALLGFLRIRGEEAPPLPAFPAGISCFLDATLVPGQPPALSAFSLPGQQPVSFTIEKIDYQTLKKGGMMRQIQEGYFAIRLGAIGGNTTSAALENIAAISRKYGSGDIHLTARQGMEIQNVHISDLADALTAIQQAGIPMGACGPRVRTVTACPGNAICQHGLINTSRLARDLVGRFQGRDLPHKFKIGVTGCTNNCLKTEENDLGIKGCATINWDSSACTQCGLCLSVCPAHSMTRREDGLSFNTETCIGCGACVSTCPATAFSLQPAYQISFGGTFGKDIVTGQKLLAPLDSQEDVLGVIDATLEFYCQHGQRGERFAKTLARTGPAPLIRHLEGRNVPHAGKFD